MRARFLPRSLHGRMLLVSAAATLAALALAGLAIAALLERFVTEGLDQRLDAEIALLASAVDRDGRVDRASLDRRLGAFEDGPGWRWRIAGPDGATGSDDFPALDAGPPLPLPPGPGPAPTPERHIRPMEGRDADDGAIHARRLIVQTRRGPVTLTAAAPRAVVRRPIRAALVPLLATLAALALLLTAALLVQLRVGLRPLRRLREEVAAIRAGTRTRVDEAQPAELRPLAEELNALAADTETALATARRSAANLAHALKTPVATLAIDLRDRPAAAAQVARIDATIRHHLARARSAATGRRAATPLAPALADLAAAVRRIHQARGIAIELAIAGDLAVAVEAQDLDELAGNLVDNAARHAAARVTIAAESDPADVRRVTIHIADDGAGIPAEDRALVARPGTRLDERGDGHGFGLAIAADLAALYGGTMALDAAPAGGLLVRLTLPAAG